MRIGVDASFLRPGVRHTGMGVYTASLIWGLAILPDRYDVHLLGYGPRPAGVPDMFPWHSIPRMPLGKADLWLSHQVVLPLMARKLGLDVLHIPGVNVRLSQPGVPFLCSCPMVVTVHDAIPATFYGKSGPPLPWRLRLAYRFSITAVRRARNIVTVSETSRTDILSALPLAEERITVIHNGVPDLPTLTEPQVDAELASLGIPPSYLLYVGSYEPRKNLVGAVDAYAAARRIVDLPRLILVVEANSGHTERARQQIAETGSGEHVIWLHSVSDATLSALYARAALFIYPSLYEGFGFTPLQAMRAGVPVIAGRAGAMPEVLGEAAVLVDPTDSEEISRAIARLYSDPVARAAYRKKGLQRAKEFSWVRAAQEVIGVYETAAGRPLPRRPYLSDA